MARPLGAHRRAGAGGGPRGRVLRRRRPRQVRPPHGLHRHHALLGRPRVRRPDRRRRRGRPRAAVHQVGHGLLHQGPHRAQRALDPGRRRQLGPLLLAAAGGHDDVAAGVQGGRRAPWLGGGRRDGRRHGRRVHRVPASRRRALRAPPPPPRAAAVRVRGQVQGAVRRERAGGEELLPVGERVQRRAAVGGAVAAPRHRRPRVPRLRRRQRRRVRRHRLGGLRVQLGHQVPRPPDPRLQAAAGGGGPELGVPGGAGEVPCQGRVLRVLQHEQEPRRRRPQRAAHPGGAHLHPPLEQPPVRDQRRLPPHGPLRLPGRARGAPPLHRRRGRRHLGHGRRDGGGRRGRRRGRAGVRQGAGGLHPGHQPDGDELPGRVQRPVPAAGAPPGGVDGVAHGREGVHRVHAGVRLVVQRRGGEPARPRRRRRRRARRRGPVQRPAGRVHADRGLHVQHRAHGRRLLQAHGARRARAAAGATRPVKRLADRR